MKFFSLLATSALISSSAFALSRPPGEGTGDGSQGRRVISAAQMNQAILAGLISSSEVREVTRAELMDILDQDLNQTAGLNYCSNNICLVTAEGEYHEWLPRNPAK